MENIEYNNMVRNKFIELNLSTNANESNTMVIDCFYNKSYKEKLLSNDNNNTTYDYEPTKQLKDAIVKEILKVKNTNITNLLLRIHSPYDNSNDIYNSMNIQKNYLLTYLQHQMNIYLFDNIKSDFYKFI